MKKRWIPLAMMIAIPFTLSAKEDEGHHLITPETIERYEIATQSAAEIGDKYFQAFMKKDWDTIEPLLADHASFRDVTAEILFDAVLHDGKEAVMKILREGFAAIDLISFEPIRTMHSGNYAVYEGTLTWQVKVDADQVFSMTMPIMTILRIENGLVVEHRDFAVYEEFVRQAKSSQ